MEDEGKPGFSRRGVLSGGALTAAAAATVALPGSAGGQTSAAVSPDGLIAMSLRINGRSRRINADVRTTLLDALRERSA